MSQVKKVVLAYSGGLDTSIIIPWIKENYGGAEIVAYCGDVGQGDDLEAVRRKALATGASKCVVEDLREEFVRDYAYAALAAGAVYEDNYLLGTALARPLLAYRQVQTALNEGADALAHGCLVVSRDERCVQIVSAIGMVGHADIVARDLADRDERGGRGGRCIGDRRGGDRYRRAVRGERGRSRVGCGCPARRRRGRYRTAGGDRAGHHPENTPIAGVLANGPRDLQRGARLHDGRPGGDGNRDDRPRLRRRVLLPTREER